MTNEKTTVLSIDKYFDVDRKDNAYILTVKKFLNKKKEEVQEIIRVEHMGKIDRQIAYQLCENIDARQVWPRCGESGDFNRIVRYAELERWVRSSS